MYKHFNKYGNIEITENILKYRISLEYLDTDNVKQIENEIKQRLIEIDKDIFITPIDVKIINRYLVIYYNMEHLRSYDRLREFSLLENIPYFLSLIDLAIAYEKGYIFSWERLNFVVDEFSKSVKIIVFETPTLKVYTEKVDLIKAVKDMIISALTRQNTFIALPKRHDFIDASEENVHFVEKLYKLETLEDIQLFLKTEALNLEQKTYDEINNEENVDTPKKVKKTKNTLAKKTKKTTSVEHKKKSVNSTTGSKSNKRIDKNMIILFALVGISIIVFLVLNFMSAIRSAESSISYDEDVSNVFTNETHDNTESLKILEVYREMYNSNIEEAYNIISTLPNHEISVDDVELVIDVYFRNNKSAELLDKYPNLANDYITYLISKNLISQLPNYVEGMKTENPYIQFEVAYLKNKYHDVLLYKEQVEMNARRESQIVEAYIQTEQYKEALEFARSTNNPDLITQAERAGK